MLKFILYYSLNFSIWFWEMDFFVKSGPNIFSGDWVHRQLNKNRMELLDLRK